MMEIVITLLGGLGAGILAFFVSVRSLYSEDVVKERQEWREKIRTLSAGALQAVRDKNTEALGQIKHDFAVRLNPGCLEDKRILQCLSCFCIDSEKQNREITGRVSFLLKHDWERVKLESSYFAKLGHYAHRVPWKIEYHSLKEGPKFRKGGVSKPCWFRLCSLKPVG